MYKSLIYILFSLWSFESVLGSANITNFNRNIVTEFDSVRNSKASNQKDSLHVTGGLDILSNFVWRGVALDPYPCLQPSLVIGGGGVEFGILGSYSLGGTFNVTPVYLKYTIKTKAGSFTPMLFDYYYPFKEIPFDNFNDDNTGAHTLEASLTYKNSAIPLKLFFSVNILNDTARSTYTEISYSFKVKEKYSIEPFVGASLEEQSAWLGADTRGISNVGITLAGKFKPFNQFTIPFSVTYAVHTQLHYAYLSARIGFVL